jgi:hypothetical protein
MAPSPFTLRVLALLALAAPAAPQSTPQRAGWYAGVAGGHAEHTDPDRGLVGVLAGAGFNNPQFSDDLDGGVYKLFAGYRFADSPVSFEAAFVDFATIEGDYAVPPPPGGVGGTYDEETWGVQLLARVSVWESEDLAFALRAGAWWRDTDVDVRVQPGNVPLSYDENDIHATLGADASYWLTEHIGVRGEYERYYMDGKGADVLALGLFYDFD